ncbi:LacI family transcription regulator [Rhodococcus ruber BKS 20-38]|uniref:LacI family transcription regulator n=1 Tax=Rhodococcus ruber BKS 20-38 TaxID=1278076 RepID=M3A466_9NOCA|nr:LacI family DNA-binding transcriptional regulator [Rhodococcus ruber]EME67264.1 LacI family transcription regulator [Rhodococcus ruber BKS 20-38]
MDDVAAQAGVSRTLVSLIFSGKPGAGAATRDRVLRAAEDLGYRPDSAARSLARGRSRTLGVLMDVHQPFQADLVAGIYAASEELGYEVLLSARAQGREEGRAIESLLGHRCEGLILLGPYSETSSLEALADRAVVVVVGRVVPHDRIDCVHTADAEGIAQAVDYLVGLGHVDICHVDGGADPGSEQRREAYLATMHRHGLSDRARIVPGAHNEAAGIAAGRLLLAEGSLPTAVLAGNDRCAVGLMDHLTRAGIDVPGDVSIIGYDDTRLAEFARIDLTTVRQDSAALARAAVGLADRRLADATAEPTELVLDPTLVVRGSTGPARVRDRAGR